MKNKNWEIHKYMENKGHDTEQTMGLRKMKREIKKYLETNETRHTIYKNLWGTPEAVRGGKFRGINVFIKKQEKAKINNPTLDLKELEKEELSKGS